MLAIVRLLMRITNNNFKMGNQMHLFPLGREGVGNLFCAGVTFLCGSRTGLSNCLILMVWKSFSQESFLSINFSTKQKTIIGRKSIFLYEGQIHRRRKRKTSVGQHVL